MELDATTISGIFKISTSRTLEDATSELSSAATAKLYTLEYRIITPDKIPKITAAIARFGLLSIERVDEQTTAMGGWKCAVDLLLC